MEEKALLSKKFIMVGMDDVQISTDETPIIGTEALATCVGILIYSEEKKKAIVAHVSSEIKSIVKKTLEIVFENELQNTPLKYKVIEGYYYNHYDIKKELEKIFSLFNPLFVPFSKEEIPENAIQQNKEFTSHEFAFNSTTGKFVTDKVLFGIDYINANKKHQK